MGFRDYIGCRVVPCWCPHKKDYSILGSTLGYPYLGELPFGLNQ